MPSQRKPALVPMAIAVGLSLLVAGCDKGSDAPARPDGDVSNTAVAKKTGTASKAGPLSTEPDAIATKLDVPWSVAFSGATPLVSLRDSGRILELTGTGKNAATHTVGTIDEVQATGEGGLLGIAVKDDHLYVYYTASDGNRIVRYGLTGKPGSLAMSKPKTLAGKIPAGPNHNGGRLAFGPDGMLYATTGDAGDDTHAQSRKSRAGKILRMTTDGKAPEDNPFKGSLVYSMGHRNPQGIAWTDDGTMYASEFGQDTWDELNVIKAGANYGWPEVEGKGKKHGFTDPIAQWRTSEASPSGMAIKGGTAYIANLRGERLRTVNLAKPTKQREYYKGDYGRLRDVVTTPDGALWMVTNNTDGRGGPGPGDDTIRKID